MLQVAFPMSDTLEDHVAVKKLFWRVMVMAVEAVVVPVGYTMVRVPPVGTVRTPLASKNSATNWAVFPEMTLVGKFAPLRNDYGHSGTSYRGYGAPG